MDNIYQLSQDVITLFTQRNKTLFTAESCTGGMISSCLTGISGASAVFLGGVCCYSNPIKSSLLSVQKNTLDKFGAVSFECVIEMAKGALEISNSDYTLAVTGIAGPNGGTTDKPVGTVYTSIASRDGGWAQQFVFQGNREEIRNKSVEMILKILIATELEQDFFDLELCNAREF